MNNEQLADNEVNRILAEFMGWVKQELPTGLEEKFAEDQYCDNSGEMVGVSHLPRYIDSLDAQIPVIKKLATKTNEGWWLNISRHGVNNYHMAFFRHSDEDYDHVDCVDAEPANVSAYALVKAIMEINK